jgi:hypothetical protein
MNKIITILMAVLSALALVLLGVLAVRIHTYLTYDHFADDRCWVKGGVYKDGSCEMPVDKLTPEAKVCKALDGTFVVAKDKTTGTEELTCYDREGKIKELPNLEGKEVIVVNGGVVLRDKVKK